MKTLLMILFMTTGFATEEKALQQIKSYGKALKLELKAAMKKSPEHAVEVCNLKAPQIQNKNSNENIKIGRVSTKNRNPNNFPKKWMLETIQAYQQNKIQKPFTVVSLENGKQGLLKPIKTMPLCLNCHGTNIDPKLYSTIKKKYPNDKAVGYKAGQIRGFFWAEY